MAFYRNMINKCLPLLSVILSCSAMAAAQQILPAQAKDASASGVDVSLVEISTGRIMNTRADAKGNFSFNNVGAGSYKLRFGCAVSNSSGNSASGKAESVQREPRECLAEMRVQMSENSNGSISGVIHQSSPKQ